MPKPARAIPPFVALCVELLAPLGQARARSMFGGHGLYVDGLMIGLVASDQLYLKTDSQTIEVWRSAKGQPFSYTRGDGKPPVEMSYWTPPAEALDAEHAMLPWARLALAAAVRSHAGKAAVLRKRTHRSTGR